MGKEGTWSHEERVVGTVKLVKVELVPCQEWTLKVVEI